MAHLVAGGEEHQCAGFDHCQIREQGVDHFCGEGLCVARVGVGFCGDEGALQRVVERAGDLQRGDGRVAVQARLAQEEIELSTAGERGRCEHRAAHCRPQVVAQRVARQEWAGVGFDDDVVAIHFEREPLGCGRAAAFWWVLQQQGGGGVHGFQARRECADLRVQRREAAGLVGLFFHLAAQRFGDGAQCGEKAFRVVRGLRQGLDQFGGQPAALHSRAGHRVGCGVARWRVAEAACVGTRLGRAQLLGVDVGHQACGVLQRGAQAGRVIGNVGDLFHFDELADAQCAAGELVDPGESRQIGFAFKLAERGAGQVVGFVDHEQAVVQLGQQACAQRRQQQIVIGHDDLCGDQFLAALVVGALAEHRAMLAGARCGLCAHGAPDFGLGWCVERVAVAVP